MYAHMYTRYLDVDPQFTSIYCLVVWSIFFFPIYFIGNVIIPTDELHQFQRGRLNHQPVIVGGYTLFSTSHAWSSCSLVKDSKWHSKWLKCGGYTTCSDTVRKTLVRTRLVIWRPHPSADPRAWSPARQGRPFLGASLCFFRLVMSAMKQKPLIFFCCDQWAKYGKIIYKTNDGDYGQCYMLQAQKEVTSLWCVFPASNLAMTSHDYRTCPSRVWCPLWLLKTRSSQMASWTRIPRAQQLARRMEASWNLHALRITQVKAHSRRTCMGPEKIGSDCSCVVYIYKYLYIYYVYDIY